MDSGLWQEIKNHPGVMGVSVGLHVLLVILLSVSLSHNAPRLPDRPAVKTVQAVVVDSAQVNTELEKLKQIEVNKRKKEESRKNKLENEMKKAREARKKEEQRLADLKKKQQQREKAEKEKQKKLAAEQKKKEQELAKLEKKRKAEQEKLAAIEKQRQQQEESERRKQEEAELKRQLLEEERRQAKLNTRLQNLRAQYIKSIEQKVVRNWLPPVKMQPGWSCEVSVRQNPLGEVTSVKMLNCTGSSAFNSTVERAVKKASPLPVPPDPQVFEAKIQFTFRPDI
ncbi:MAG: cell envelope integrity protein TolA [Gammaproteobacteria bacterium]|nr:cell envelope integrity protein TolA [Gammaproteobacteria bacterium]